MEKIKMDIFQNQMNKSIDCEHKNWRLAGYPVNIYGSEYVRVQSIYEVYCNDCENFVHLLTGEIINNKGLIIDRR